MKTLDVTTYGTLVLAVMVLTSIVKALVVETFSKSGARHDAAVMLVNLLLSVGGVLLGHVAQGNLAATQIVVYLGEAIGVALAADKAFGVAAHLGISVGSGNDLLAALTGSGSGSSNSNSSSNTPAAPVVESDQPAPATSGL